MAKIGERLRAIVENCTKETRRFKDLEEKSVVSAEAWRSFWNGKQRPSAEMIEAVAQLWPEYAFWLATGIDDTGFGHRTPSKFEFPALTKQITAAGDLFRYKVELQHALNTGELQEVTRDAEDAMDDLAALRWNQIQRQRRAEEQNDGADKE